MSLQFAEKFYERLENDPKLAEKIQELQNPETINHYIRDELGYDFTRKEMQEVIFERKPELSDEELEAVVGGLSHEEEAGLLIGSTIGVATGTLAFAAAAAAAA